MSTSVLWFRRDLRLTDNPALLAATRSPTLPLFVIDPALWGPAGPVRRAYLARSLRRLDESLGGALHVRTGDPALVVPQVAAQVAASQVHCAADFAPYGSRRDHEVRARLAAAGAALVETGSPYAVPPGQVTKADGSPYRVFSAFYRAWVDRGCPGPAPGPGPDVSWVRLTGGGAVPAEPALGDLALPEVGEVAARDRWARFVADGLARYHLSRNRPDLAGTSSMSAALRWGEIHPRTLLADVADLETAQRQRLEVFRKELAWREFYADVLHHIPDSARRGLRTDLAAIDVDTGPAADDLLHAWQQGLTGYPFVDAGMRQLRSEGWMHNRVRMVVASFLVKDLHLHWTQGARWFLRWLRDGDLASNQHGWQWVAGVGTDAAPYYRIFNPVRQGVTFDPDGDYVRRYVPQLRQVPGPAVHQPWALPGGMPPGYPRRVVDHEQARRDALERYSAARRTGPVTVGSPNG